MRKVSKHLQLFLCKRGICFCNYSVTVLLNKLLRCIVRHGTSVLAVVMAMGLLYRLHIMVKSVLYEALDLLVS